MKFLSILAAVSLAFAPVIASAGSSNDSTDNDRPISGPLAGRVLDESAIPVGAIVVGGLVILGGVVIGVLASNGSNNSTNKNSSSQ